jgi:hypothetical protein
MILARPGRVAQLLCIGSLFLPASTAAPGQDALPDAPSASVRRFELGGQLTDIQLAHCYHVTLGCLLPVPQLAGGPAAALSLNTHLAVDAIYNVFTTYDNYYYASDYGGRGSELLVGVRVQARARRYGLSAFERPGFTHWNGVVTQLLGSTVVARSPETYFANEAGGGVEYLPSKRVRVNLEMGDLIVNRRDHHGYDFGSWTNNLQTSAGVYVGVGRPIFPRPPAVQTVPPHRFFDRTNLLLIGVSLLGQGADAITTQRFHSHGQQEQDPLARPFVNQGWAGQIGLAAIYNAAQVTAMVGLHKMGQHEVERLVPLVVAAAGAYNGYSNLQGE